MLGCILYSALVIPYRICFDDDPDGLIWYWEVALSIVLLADVVVNFNTAYLDDDDRWVYARPKIAMNYFRGWFWIDAPSSTPVEIITALLEDLVRGSKDSDARR